MFFIVLETDICNFADDNSLHTSAINLDVLMKKLVYAAEKAID